MAIEVPDDYGYVLLTFLASFVVNLWLGGTVGKARKKYGVKYPTMYLVTIKDGIISQDNQFNCVQRSHQNMLEIYPSVMGLVILSGLQFPILASIGGCIWLFGRAVYAIGYQTGDPKKRVWGSFQWIGVLILLYTTVSAAFSLIKTRPF